MAGGDLPARQGRAHSLVEAERPRCSARGCSVGEGTAGPAWLVCRSRKGRVNWTALLGNSRRSAPISGEKRGSGGSVGEGIGMLAEEAHGLSWIDGEVGTAGSLRRS